MTRYNPDGHLDESFGVGGMVTDFMGNIGEASAMLIQPDGKIVVCGGRLARFFSDGQLDIIFSSESVTAPISINAIAIQPDGKIVGAGVGTIAAANTGFGLVRYNPNGTFDTTFGFVGKIFTDLTPNADVANALVIQPDGKLLVGGVATTIYIPSSNPAPFIYVPAFENSDFALLRYNANGSLDVTFGAGGRVFTDFFDQYFPPPAGLDIRQDDGIFSIALRRDGKIVVAGGAQVWTGINNVNSGQFALARYNPDGSADSTFSGDGRLTTKAAGFGGASALALLRDGRSRVAGTVSAAHDSDFALLGFAADDAPDFEVALRQHVPVLQFSSAENFFPLKVEAITDNPGNKLLNGLSSTQFVTIATKPPPAGRWPLLSINLLKQTYPAPIYFPADGDDKIEEAGGSGNAGGSNKYFTDARQFQSDPNYADRIYGRVYYGFDGQGRKIAWLQYWFFYYYNDYHHETLTGTRYFDLHEGDWEMVQVALDANAQPVSAFYAQHDGGSQCRWSDVEKDLGGQRPVVYVARGSHASYFRRGAHSIRLLGIEIGLDIADGAILRSEPTFVEINDRGPDWINWLGRWGGTQKKKFLDITRFFDGDSPRGPKFQGDKWTDPLAFPFSKDSLFRCQ
jgi:uncharacterized delta-60 repeat protein